VMQTVTTDSGRRRHNPAAQLIILSLAFVVLIVVTAATVFLVATAQSDASRVEYTLTVQNKLSELHVLVRRADAAQRGYLLIEEPDLLAAYHSAADAVLPELASLSSAIADNPSQQQALASLESLVQLKLTDLAETVSLFESGHHDAALALMRAGRGSALAQQIRDVLKRMVGEEQRLLALHTAQSRRTNLRLEAVGLFGGALLITLAAVSIFMVRRANTGREAALTALQVANVGLEATIADRTRHLHDAYEEIRRTVDILNNTINSMVDAVVVIDQHMNTLLMNPASAQILGLTEGVMPKDWPKLYRVFQPDETTPIPFASGAIARAVRGEPVDNMEIYVCRVDETTGVHLLVNGRALHDASGAIIGAVMVYRDISEARQAERRLRQAQKMDAIGQLTGGIAHDFNNILTVITGTIDILAGAVADQPRFAAIAKMIDEAAERGAELTRRLLAFARRQPLQPRATDVNVLVLDSAKLLQPTLGEQIEIDSMLENDAWPAEIDPSQLATALLNLALNARDAMPAGGKLMLETANVYLDKSYANLNFDVRPGPYVMIAVSDTGSGIPESIRDRVFEPFFTTKETGKGTGLGLSMVYGFVKQSGGHIKIYSEESQGTTVKLYLPRACGDANPIEETTTRTAVQGGHETILVVEDDPMVRSYVFSQLESLGYVTLGAESGAEALAIIDKGTPIDLLFTDVVMPGMNGRVLAEELKRRPRIKVLFTSGYTENAIVHHGRLDPGVLLLPKPYRKADVARMIRIALDATPFEGAAA
jgi:PAS domain S-box-containing protein